MQVLSSLDLPYDPRLLVGTAGFDDAGVAQLDERWALVQTVDFFPPVVDDPWWFGRIAAANALSDVYAMGATPFSALNIVCFPRAALPLDVLATILKGGADACREAGAMLLGGHSVDDDGLKFGMAVTGFVAPGAQVTNAGARPGDRIYLTKPLGTGAITTAAKAGKVDAAVLAGAVASMGALNRGAGEGIARVPVHAATDVTGYGLVGHGSEMALASGVDLVLRAGALPVLAGARACLESGRVSGGAARTQAYLGARLVLDASLDATTRLLVADAETSGGLLIAVAPEHAARLEDALTAAGVLVACVGEVTDGSGRVRVLP